MANIDLWVGTLLWTRTTKYRCKSDVPPSGTPGTVEWEGRAGKRELDNESSFFLHRNLGLVTTWVGPAAACVQLGVRKCCICRAESQLSWEQPRMHSSRQPVSSRPPRGVESKSWFAGFLFCCTKLPEKTWGLRSGNKYLSSFVITLKRI